MNDGRIVLRHSFANPGWWGWHRYLYALHRLLGKTRY